MHNTLGVLKYTHKNGFIRLARTPISANDNFKTTQFAINYYHTSAWCLNQQPWMTKCIKTMSAWKLDVVFCPISGDGVLTMFALAFSSIVQTVAGGNTMTSLIDTNCTANAKPILSLYHGWLFTGIDCVVSVPVNTSILYFCINIAWRVCLFKYWFKKLLLILNLLTVQFTSRIEVRW